MTNMSLCEHAFVTSQGSPYGRFARAIERRQLSLADALALVALYAVADDAKFEQAAVKYLGRLCHERAGLSLGSLQLAAAALSEPGGSRHDAALNVLLRLL